MLDLKFIRDNTEQVRKAIEDRQDSAPLDDPPEVDAVGPRCSPTALGSGVVEGSGVGRRLHLRSRRPRMLRSEAAMPGEPASGWLRGSRPP